MVGVMCFKWFFALDKLNYASLISIYLVERSQLERTDPEIWLEISNGHWVVNKKCLPLFSFLFYRMRSCDGRGLILWLFVPPPTPPPLPPWVYLYDFFCSRIQFYLLLSPYLCFISLLYLDLYVLGDDELIS